MTPPSFSLSPAAAHTVGSIRQPAAVVPPAAGWWSEAAFWATHSLFWLVALGGLLLVIDVYRPGVPISTALVAAQIGCGFMATAAMRWLSMQEIALRRIGISKIGLVAGGLLTSAVVITLAVGGVQQIWGVNPAAGRGLGLLANLVINLMLLGNWCAIYFGTMLIRERNSAEFRAIEAESLALKNELHRLQAQISPHFLFNALNTIVASREKPAAIDTITQALANYLRFLLRPVASLEPLSRELDALEQYLTVQAARFGDGLVTRIDCDLAVRGVRVPPVMIQPLVENALKYGAESGPRPLRLEISARREGGWLVVEVANTGRWVKAAGRDATGTGLASLERRLALVIGPRAVLTRAEENGWVRVWIRIPLDEHLPPATDAADPPPSTLVRLHP